MTGWAQLRAANARAAAASHRGEAEHLRATSGPSATDAIARAETLAAAADRTAVVYGGLAWHQAAAQAEANLAAAGADLETIRGTFTEVAA